MPVTLGTNGPDLDNNRAAFALEMVAVIRAAAPVAGFGIEGILLVIPIAYLLLGHGGFGCVNFLSPISGARLCC